MGGQTQQIDITALRSGSSHRLSTYLALKSKSTSKCPRRLSPIRRDLSVCRCHRGNREISANAKPKCVSHILWLAPVEASVICWPTHDASTK